MPESGGFEVRIAGAARRDVLATLRRSGREFGEAAATRYAALIERALGDIGENPERPGSKARPEMGLRVRTWHLELSVKRTEGQRVRNPRHFIVYRLNGGYVEILRLLHDARDLPKHKPAGADESSGSG